MIQTKTKSFSKLAEEAIDRAKNKQVPQLLSITDKIEKIDPFHFFEQAKHMGQNRLFWASTEEDFYLVGAGEAYALHAQANENRFEQTEQQWKQMLANAFIYNPFQVPGTGPIAVGGYSFDPKKENTTLWGDFHDSQFRIPSYLLSIVDGMFYLTCNIVIHSQDHPQQLEHEVDEDKQLLLSPVTLPNAPIIKSQNEIEPNDWKETVEKATEAIKQNKASKIVLARELRVAFEEKAKITPVLYNLMKTQTNSYIFAFENKQDCFLGATPERLVRVQDQQLLSTCLAGTAPRGRTEEEDKQFGNELLHDVKNRQEHQFVVEMIREAVDACCDGLDIPKQPVLYPLKNLQHLYTPVKAKLKQQFTIFDVVKRLHPTPALGGLPKQASLSFIRVHEKLDRGWYGAPIGWLDANQNGEFAVAIRSALVQGKEASLFAGCGVVKDSDPEAEYQETTMKFTPMLSVLGG